MQVTKPHSKVVAYFGADSRFRREHRLAKHDVLGLLRDGARLSRAEFAVKLDENSGSGGRIAIAVPKRILKRAIDRNIVKRLIREEFRQNALRALPVDLLVTLRATAGVRPGEHATGKRQRRQLQSSLRQIFSDVSLRFGG